MTITTRMLAFLPRDAGALDRPEVAAGFIAWGARNGLKPLVLRPCLVLADAEPLAAAGGELTIWNVDAGKRAGLRATWQDPATFGWSAIHDHATARFDVYNVLRVGPDGLRLESDRVGLKPIHVAEVPAGTLVANYVLDLLSLMPDLAAEPDPVAVQEFLSFGYPIGPRTLHAGVKRTPCGAVLRWQPGGRLDVTTERRVRAIRADPGHAVMHAARMIRDTIRDEVARRCQGVGVVHLALTGGFDSRFMLGICQDLGLQVRAVTYGNRLHREVAVARRLARMAGIQHEVIPYSTTGVRDSLDINSREVEAASDLVFGVAHLLRSAVPPGGLMLNGFIGGLLCGSNLTRWTKGAHLGSYEQALEIAVGVHGLRPDAALDAWFGQGVDTSAIRDDMARALVTEGEPYQALMLWDIEMRQRRHLGPHFRLLGTHWDVSIPFADDRSFDAHLSLPRALLDNRAIVRHVLRLFYPRLAALPHAEETASILPGPVEHLRAAARGLLARVPGFWRLDLRNSRKVSVATRLRIASVREIWQVSMHQLMRDRRLLLRRMEAAFPAARRLYGMAAPAFDPAPLQGLGPREFSRVLALFEYAAAVDARLAGKA